MKYHLIDSGSINSVVDKAKQYRLLLEPELAISICMDIFAIKPNHQEALVIYILALTDQLGSNDRVEHKKIIDAIAKLDAEFQRHYYAGIFLERKARSLLKNNSSRSFAYDSFLDAIKKYEVAEKIAPQHCSDPVLRYNSCIRTIEKENLQPMTEEFNEFYE